MDHNRDYILRIVQLLIDALLSISRSVDKEDFIGAKKQIDYSFKILRKPEVFFVNASLKDITIYLENLPNSSEMTELAGRLLFYRATIEKSPMLKKQLFIKSELLFSYFLDTTNTISYDSINFHNKIKKEVLLLSL